MLETFLQQICVQLFDLDHFQRRCSFAKVFQCFRGECTLLSGIYSSSGPFSVVPSILHRTVVNEFWCLMMYLTRFDKFKIVCPYSSTVFVDTDDGQYEFVSLCDSGTRLLASSEDIIHSSNVIQVKVEHVDAPSDGKTFCEDLFNSNKLSIGQLHIGIILPLRSLNISLSFTMRRTRSGKSLKNRSYVFLASLIFPFA